MHQPPDIGGELLRLGAWQQHAIVERMQESAFRHPPFFFDENAVHHRDLSGGAAEAQRSDAQPDTGGFADRNTMSRLLAILIRRQSDRIRHIMPPSCWWASCAFPRSRREPI